ncbi:protein-glutamate O-methyltransferase CheR [Xanthocytophaga agilis]|uniref:protein-glutamate O-methyltransferase n=1 Tax=Xanthocytophaga agilis TaxID=3048010 RepID=A0AAE3RAC2_9BACT|nr:protein-glutamate O-methyltransferase CheR [Xanthocytophaga agilis]MDJ1504430.1 protein-glutamate O-methyltransferase CheR [Xanthocytophaga agilis]
MILTHTLKLTNADFNRLSAFIYERVGIKLSPIKKTMLESRLQKRLSTLQMGSFKEYCDYIFSDQGKQQELVHMIDQVTTNKTDFFREPNHFSFLQSQLLPSIDKHYRTYPLRVWSAGCSSGEEVYTLAMVLSEYSCTHTPISFHIHGTDISTQVLQKAVTAVYTEDKIAPIPLLLRQKYLLKSKDTTNRTVRVAPSLRSKVQFDRLNFMEDDFNSLPVFDIIFCRNVIIYFDKATQEQVLNRLCTQLRPGGFFFLGHSESITNMDVPLKQIRPTIFQKVTV